MFTLRPGVIAVCSALLTICGSSTALAIGEEVYYLPASVEMQQQDYTETYDQGMTAQAHLEQMQQQDWQQIEAERQQAQEYQAWEQQQQQLQLAQAQAQWQRAEQQRQQQLQQQQRQQQLTQQQRQLQQQRQQQLAQQQRQLQQQRQQQLAQQQRQRQQQLANQQPFDEQPEQTYAEEQAQPAAFAAGRTYNGPGRFTRLPNTVIASLRQSRAGEDGMSVYVRPVNANQPALLTANADAPRNPASTMKLVTTYTALGVLGPDYRWPTEMHVTGNITGGTLYGDVIIRGYGDPAFSENDFRSMLQALRAQGVHTITGNLVADTGFFQVPYQSLGAFDGNAGAAYNAQPEAILYHERGGCFEFSNLKGKIQKVCPVLPTNAKAKQDLNVNLFGGFWKLWVGELRGQMHGSFVRGYAPQHSRLIHTHRSRPLREIIAEVNKDSNNVMARQILLSVGAKQMGAPGTPQKGAMAVGQWLESRGLNFPELRIENGSGLSRIERISARHLGEMLVDAYNSPFRQDFMNSLAVLGVDGTLKNRMKRSNLAGRGRFKTGTLRNVRGLAGYLQAANGQMYVVSILQNDARARGGSRAAHDEMVEWVFWGPQNNYAEVRY